eukprot:scaffold18510_cov127-Skeletonema_menzelii.AAC.2
MGASPDRGAWYTYAGTDGEFVLRNATHIRCRPESSNIGKHKQSSNPHVHVDASAGLLLPTGSSPGVQGGHINR